VMNGGTVLIDRPLVLQLRKPQLSIARAIQFRINQSYQSTTVAAAKDEGVVALFVPEKYGSDWEHFVQVAMHLFLNSSADFAATKAKVLADEAVKPDAPLLDITYCWEAMGPTVIPFIAPLMTHERPEVAFAAARAAALVGDVTAQNALMNMARTASHPF